MDVIQFACFSSSHQVISLGHNDKHQGIYIYYIDSGKKLSPVDNCGYLDNKKIDLSLSSNRMERVMGIEPT